MDNVVTIGRCKDCKHFARGGKFRHTASVFDQQMGVDLTTDPEATSGLCLHPKVSSDHVRGWSYQPPMNDIADALLSSCDEERGDLLVGQMFGCIHFESGVCPPKIHFDFKP